MVPFELKVAITAALLLAAVVAGLWWRSRTGRARLVKTGELVDLSKLEASKLGEPVTRFGKRATLLQFSTEVCSVCKQTARLLGEIEKRNPRDLLHLEVDVTHRLDLAAHFGVLQTPTTLVLDHSGRVKARISGAPKPNVIQEELKKLEVAS